jgi:hypothetical protein
LRVKRTPHSCTRQRIFFSGFGPGFGPECPDFDFDSCFDFDFDFETVNDSDMGKRRLIDVNNHTWELVRAIVTQAAVRTSAEG